MTAAGTRAAGSSAADLAVRPAVAADVPFLLQCIRELAEFERLQHQLDLSAERLHQHLFGTAPACAALLATVGGAPIGFALYFTSYSTFRTRPCLYLEDLYVQPAHRGHGAGLALLKALAAEAIARGCPRLDWSVLDWNAAAIGFYERHGARLLPDWRICRLDGEALVGLARG